MEVIAAILAAIIGAIVTYMLSPRQQDGGPGVPRIPITSITRLKRIHAEKTIRVGVVKYRPLCDFHIVGGSVVASGLYIHIVEEMCKLKGLKPVYRPVTWSELSGVFAQECVDFVACVFETRLRLAAGDFICNFHKIGLGAVGRKGGKVSTIAQLSSPGVRVAVMRGGTDWEYVAEDLKMTPDQIVAVDNYDFQDVIGMVTASRADVAIADDISCIDAVSSSGGALEHLFADEHIMLCKNGFFIPRGDPELASFLDDGLRAVRNSPSVIALEKRLLAGFERVVERLQ